ncbi:MAG: hypothetical protein K2F91_08905 [Muribaculaceae bacterium]|nr:hypothetical protein [Muribaculaceae bacterium]
MAKVVKSCHLRKFFRVSLAIFNYAKAINRSGALCGRGRRSLFRRPKRRAAQGGVAIHSIGELSQRGCAELSDFISTIGKIALDRVKIGKKTPENRKIADFS